MKILKLIFLAALTLYLIVAAAVFLLQRKLLYFPPSDYLTPMAVGVPDMSEVEMRFGDGAWATAWYVPPANPDGKVVMVFHGNGSAVYSNHDIFRDLMGEGYGVLSVGYPGYPGRSPVLAESTQSNLLDAALYQYDYLIGEGHAPDNIIFYGTSLGSGVAAQLASKHQPALLIMDAPFNSILDMARKQVPWLPVSLLMKDKFESDKAISGLDVPLIWIHGTADRVVPISQGQKLYDGYGGPKTAHVIEGGQHTNLWFLGGRDIVLKALSDL
jgi:fermentation-respiration switch protein FrsA (DUF1100 family)